MTPEPQSPTGAYSRPRQLGGSHAPTWQPFQQASYCTSCRGPRVLGNGCLRKIPNSIALPSDTCQQSPVQRPQAERGSNCDHSPPCKFLLLQSWCTCQSKPPSVLHPQLGVQAAGSPCGHMPRQLFSCLQPPSQGLANPAAKLTKEDSVAGLTEKRGTWESHRVQLPSFWDLHFCRMPRLGQAGPQLWRRGAGRKRSFVP